MHWLEQHGGGGAKQGRRRQRAGGEGVIWEELGRAAADERREEASVLRRTPSSTSRSRGEAAPSRTRWGRHQAMSLRRWLSPPPRRRARVGGGRRHQAHVGGGCCCLAHGGGGGGGEAVLGAQGRLPAPSSLRRWSARRRLPRAGRLLTISRWRDIDNLYKTLKKNIKEIDKDAKFYDNMSSKMDKPSAEECWSEIEAWEHGCRQCTG